MFGQTLGILDVIEAIRTLDLATALAVTPHDAIRVHGALAPRDERHRHENARYKSPPNGQSTVPSIRQLFHVRTNHGAVGLVNSSHDTTQ
jgi:hypothetical protein